MGSNSQSGSNIKSMLNFSCSSCTSEIGSNSQVDLSIDGVSPRRLYGTKPTQRKFEEYNESEVTQISEINKEECFTSKAIIIQSVEINNTNDTNQIIEEDEGLSSTVKLQNLIQKVPDYQWDKIHQSFIDVYITKAKFVKIENMRTREGMYTGEIDSKSKKKHGKGKCQFKDGSLYEGLWEFDQQHGHGRYINTEGNVYDGEWKLNKKHGYGELTYTSGQIYQGNFCNGIKQGHGTEKWPDGATYNGNFEQDKMHGQGELVKPNFKYVGNFKYSLFNGNGKITSKDGSKYQGEWKDSKKNGRGQQTFKDGKTYIGHFKQDKKHGQGIFTQADGRIYEGAYNNNKQHGLGKFKKPSGEQIFGIWSKGKVLKQFDFQIYKELKIEADKETILAEEIQEQLEMDVQFLEPKQIIQFYRHQTNL